MISHSLVPQVHDGPDVVAARVMASNIPNAFREEEALRDGDGERGHADRAIVVHHGDDHLVSPFNRVVVV